MSFLCDKDIITQKNQDKMGCSCRKGVSPDDTSTTRVVVLGTGGAGKSTVIKQVRIANGDKFSVEERKQAVRTICGIILLGLEASSSYVMDSGINGLSSTKTEEKDIQEEKEEPHDNHIFDIPPEQAAETANLITRLFILPSFSFPLSLFSSKVFLLFFLCITSC